MAAVVKTRLRPDGLFHNFLLLLMYSGVLLTQSMLSAFLLWTVSVVTLEISYSIKI